MIKAAVCRAFDAPLAIETLTLADPGPEEIRVRVAAVSLCQSDLTYIGGKWGGTLPAVYGHEAAGVVDMAGADTPFVPGDRVIVTLIRACGACPCCASGLETSCDRRFDPREGPLTDATGARVVQGLNCGAFAEAMTVHHVQAVKVPDAMPLDVASLLACGVITGVGAVTNTASLQPGETCAVIGAGGVGLNTIQGAALAGASKIIAVDLSDEKLQTAIAFGATHGILSGSGVTDAVRAETDGRGVDYAFVTVGAPMAFQSAPDLLSGGGAMVIVGMTGSEDRVPYAPVNLATMNQRFLGSSMGQTRLSRDIPILLDHWEAGRLKLAELIAARYPFDQINDAIDHMRSGVTGRVVVVVDPDLI